MSDLQGVEGPKPPDDGGDRRAGTDGAAFQKLYVDFFGKYPRSKKGHAWIFIVVFYKFGVPEVVHSDNGRQFTSKIFEEAMESFGIRHRRPPIYPHQSNAAERVNRSVLAAIRGFLESDHREWDAYLPEIESGHQECSPCSDRRGAVFHSVRASHVPAWVQLQTGKEAAVDV
nr:uncharacterized protein LOC121502107 [Drosophila kikkawai]